MVVFFLTVGGREGQREGDGEGEGGWTERDRDRERERENMSIRKNIRCI